MFYIRAKEVQIIIKNPIGDKIKAARKNLGLTQDQVAARLQTEGCDISRGTLAKIEVGIRKLQASEVSAFVKVLNLDYKDFLE